MTAINLKRLALALGVLTLAASVPAFADPTSYQLWCRGGKTMHATFDASDPRAIAVSFNFTWMHTAATAATPPQKGECSWLDRAMRTGEPNNMHYAALGQSIVVTMDGGGPPNVAFGTHSIVNPTLNTIWNGIAQKQEFRLMVYNAGPYMQITGVAP